MPFQPAKEVEAFARPYLLHLQSVLRLQIATKQKGRVQAALTFVDAVEGAIQRELRAVERASKAVVTTGVRGRVRRLKAMQKSITMLIRQMANDESVAKMNAEQLSGYLTGAGDGAKARRLAKRAGTSASEVVGELSAEWVAGLRERLANIKPTAVARAAAADMAAAGDDGDLEVDERCFVDLETTEEALATVAAELDNESLADLSVDMALQLFGQTGLAVRVKKEAYPDPWQVRVQAVYVNTFVSQQALYDAFKTAGATEMAVPGRPEARLNACLPLVQVGSDAYQVFKDSVMAKVQASIALRQTIATVPGDQMAMLTAAWMWLAVHDDEGNTAAGKTAKDRIVDTLRTHCSPRYLQPLTDALQEEEPECKLNGRADVTNISKVVAAVLTTSPETLGALDPPKVLRALHWMQCYAKWKNYDGDREAVALAALGVTPEVFEARTTQTQPAFTPEPAAVDHNSEWQLAALKGEVSALTTSKIVQGLFPGAAATAAMASAVSPEEVRVRNLCALQCRGVGDYVSDEGQLLQPLHDEPPTVFADYVRRQYEAAYARKLAAKEAEEAELRLQAGLAELATCTDLARFVALLKEHAPTSQHANYKRVEAAALTNIATHGAVGRSKLCVLACGHTPAKEAVWNNGGPNMKRPRAEWVALHDSVRGGDGGPTWEDIAAILSTLRRIVYRPSGVPNRHGHCEVCPSSFCLGYPSFKAFVETQSEEYLEAYFKARKLNKSTRTPHSVEQFLHGTADPTAAGDSGGAGGAGAGAGAR